MATDTMGFMTALGQAFVVGVIVATLGTKLFILDSNRLVDKWMKANKRGKYRKANG